MKQSIIMYYGEQLGKCGYCKGTECSKSHGMHAYCMNPVDYQDLIDRGWRRSGDYCYKPDNKRTCCPSYTIRCDVKNFKLSKSHKKILKRMNRFLRDGVREKTDEDGEDVKDSKTAELDGGEEGAAAEEYGSVCEQPEIPERPLHKLDELINVSASKVELSKDSATSERNIVESPATQNASPISIQSDTSKPPLKKAKQMRLERRQAKLAAKVGTEETLTPKKTAKATEKTLSDFINDACPAKDKHQLKLKLVKVSSTEFLATQKQSYKLYQKYQQKVHNDVVKKVESFLEFLHTSPLENCDTDDGPEMGYNSYHQQYWLDDKLIAVGVIDLLPHCLSSVYFFYDPDYSFLSLGTYGSLREIEFVQRLAVDWPEVKYYYMGFYIRSCPKMRYKGKLSGSYLLCPETYEWQLLTDAICAKLDECKYQRFNPLSTAVDANAVGEPDVGLVPLLLVRGNRRMLYQQYRQLAGFNRSVHEEITKYGQLVGRICAQRILYVMDV